MDVSRVVHKPLILQRQSFLQLTPIFFQNISKKTLLFGARVSILISYRSKVLCISRYFLGNGFFCIPESPLFLN